MDKYKNFEELKLHEQEGIDYEICARQGSSGIAVIALHGGGIEPGTMDIADSVAGIEHSFYCFKGIKKTGNSVLHIASSKFDEPCGVRIAEGADLVLTIHGCIDGEDVFFIGGKDADFKKCLLNSIFQAGFEAEESTGAMKGINPSNICNRGRAGKGGQIEISVGLRKQMFEDKSHGVEKGKNKVFNNVVIAIRKALENFTTALN